jgi:DNA repair protein RecN (Recombination protein N)
MQASEKIREDIGKALGAIGQSGAEGMVTDAARWLEDASEAAEDALKEPLEALTRALGALGDAQDGVLRTLDMLAFNPAELDLVEERLFAMRGLARKHGVVPDELAVLADDLRKRLGIFDGGAADLADLTAAVEAAEAKYEKAAGRLTEKRGKAAAKLDRAMAKELAPLKMERAVFATEITEGDPGPEGRDVVAFTVATNPGAPSGALNKIASGGELSRFLLALKVCLTAGQSGMTLIFDEIDRGVGGATADAVGRRLAELASGAQILVVTHSPQVAALGRHHWRVEKHATASETISKVVALGAQARIDEVARMLSGDTITDEARAAAKALLEAGV